MLHSLIIHLQCQQGDSSIQSVAFIHTYDQAKIDSQCKICWCSRQQHSNTMYAMFGRLLVLDNSIVMAIKHVSSLLTEYIPMHHAIPPIRFTLGFANLFNTMHPLAYIYNLHMLWSDVLLCLILKFICIVSISFTSSGQHCAGVCCCVMP